VLCTAAPEHWEVAPPVEAVARLFHHCLYTLRESLQLLRRDVVLAREAILQLQHILQVQRLRSAQLQVGRHAMLSPVGLVLLLLLLLCSDDSKAPCCL
jgi:hypothetical protein